MLYSTKTPEQKRADLRAMLVPGAGVQFPGAFNPLSARLIEEKKFDGVYISGAVLANDLGLPDIGMTTLTEVAARGAQIARMTELPCLIDADTGFGEPMNVARTRSSPAKSRRGADCCRRRRPTGSELPHHGPHGCPCGGRAGCRH